jgi:transcription termination factor Rho
VVAFLMQQARALSREKPAVNLILLFDERGYAVLHVRRNQEEHAEEQEPQHKRDQHLFEAPRQCGRAFRLVERQRTHGALLLHDDANRRARVALFLRRMKC